VTPYYSRREDAGSEQPDVGRGTRACKRGSAVRRRREGSAGTTAGDYPAAARGTVRRRREESSGGGAGEWGTLPWRRGGGSCGGTGDPPAEVRVSFLQRSGDSSAERWEPSRPAVSRSRGLEFRYRIEF
jgi:hypothetical protein